MIKIKPLFFEKIWGGEKIASEFNLSSKNIGEAWVISGLKGSSSEIESSEFSEKTLDVLYKSKPELFGNYPTKEFPLLIKLIYAKQNLSIQVHPDDKYAQEKEKAPFGKYESWHILEAPKGTKIIVGHNFNNEKEVQDAFDNQEWENKFPEINIQPGDTFDITPGTVHAICKGTFLYEIQQSCDITYRLYDYGRLENGQPRELHIQSSKETIDYKKQKVSKQKIKGTNLIDNIYFNLDKEKIKGLKEIKYDAFFLAITCIKGNGTINDKKISKNESVIITNKECKEIITIISYWIFQ